MPLAARAPAADVGDSGRRAIPLLVDHYLSDLAARGRPETIRQARAALARVVTGLQLAETEDVTRLRVSKWRLDRVKAGASNRTANHEVSILAAALNFGVDMGMLALNPLAGMKALPTTARHRKRIARALTEDEIRRLLAGARQVDAEGRGEFPREPTLRALILTGARWGELVKVAWSDVDVDASTITLTAENTKTERERKIPLDPEMLATIEELRRIQARLLGVVPQRNHRVFRTSTGANWMRDAANFHRYLHNAMSAGHVAYRDESGAVLHVHALRHTFATRLLRAGVDIGIVSRLLGHADPALTIRVYQHADVDVLRRAIMAVPRMT